MVQSTSWSRALSEAELLRRVNVARHLWNRNTRNRLRKDFGGLGALVWRMEDLLATARLLGRTVYLKHPQSRPLHQLYRPVRSRDRDFDGRSTYLRRVISLKKQKKGPRIYSRYTRPRESDAPCMALPETSIVLWADITYDE